MKSGIYKYQDFVINVWSERDRLNITVWDKNEEKVLWEAWDQDVEDLYDLGCINAKYFESSLIHYLKGLGVL